MSESSFDQPSFNEQNLKNFIEMYNIDIDSIKNEIREICRGNTNVGGGVKKRGKKMRGGNLRRRVKFGIYCMLLILAAMGLSSKNVHDRIQLALNQIIKGECGWFVNHIVGLSTECVIWNTFIKELALALKGDGAAVAKMVGILLAVISTPIKIDEAVNGIVDTIMPAINKIQGLVGPVASVSNILTIGDNEPVGSNPPVVAPITPVIPGGGRKSKKYGRKFKKSKMSKMYGEKSRKSRK